MAGSQSISEQACARGRAIVPGSNQAREMARAAIGTTWHPAEDLAVRALATDAPIWPEYPHASAWGWLSNKRGRERVRPIVVEARKQDGEWHHRARGSAEPLPGGHVLVRAVKRRLDFAIEHLSKRCDGGTHPNGHTLAAIEAVPSIAAARRWLAEREIAYAVRTGGSNLVDGREGADPNEPGPPLRQRDQARQDAIEDRAMGEAERYFEAQGWRPEDVSERGLGYDIRFTRGREERHVEVKGTTGSGAVVNLTHNNEVVHARECADAVLFVLSRMDVSYDDNGNPVAGDGMSNVFDPWVIDDGELTPIAYSYRLPTRD